MKKDTQKIIAMSAGAVLILFFFSVVGILIINNRQLRGEVERLGNELVLAQKNVLQAEPTPVVPAPEPVDQTTTYTDDFGNYVNYSNGDGSILKNYTQDFTDVAIEISWNHGAKPISKANTQKLIEQVDPTWKHSDFSLLCDTGSPECRLHMYELGTITAPEKLQSKKLYLLAVPQPGMGMYYATTIAFFDETTKSYIAIEHNSTEFVSISQNGVKPLVQGFFFHRIESLEKPQTLSIPRTDSILQFVKSQSDKDSSPFQYYSDANNRGGILNFEKDKVTDYTQYSNGNIAFVDKKYGPVYLMDKSYHIILPDGSVQQYELIPSFLKPLIPPGADKNLFTDRYQAKITWTDGRANEQETYMLGGDIQMGGCVAGITPCTNIANSNTWFQEDNLVPVGKTDKGELVYELKDAATNAYYKQLFDFGYAGSRLYPSTQYASGNKPALTQEQFDKMTAKEKNADFIADHPLFFWKDHVGNWRFYQKAKYQSMVECGKPVIYLYPTKDTTVQVQVNPLGGFTKTEPEYKKEGWKVRATPQSVLTNLEDNKTYPYLFWEGIGYNYVQPKQGFVLKREDVETEMKKILGQLGLNTQEQKDFLEFWAPRLTVKPYVFVTFVDQKSFDKIAPLSVSPRPDTVIRVFMDYTPLEKPRTVEPLSLITPERKGFTVVEWGGALHK